MYLEEHISGKKMLVNSYSQDYGKKKTVFIPRSWNYELPLTSPHKLEYRPNLVRSGSPECHQVSSHIFWITTGRHIYYLIVIYKASIQKGNLIIYNERNDLYFFSAVYCIVGIDMVYSSK